MALTQTKWNAYWSARTTKINDQTTVYNSVAGAGAGANELARLKEALTEDFHNWDRAAITVLLA